MVHAGQTSQSSSRFGQLRHGLALLLILCFSYSFTGCTKRADESTREVVTLHVLMSPDSTGIWHEIFDLFHRQNSGVRIGFVEGPAATNTREDLYVTSFLSGESVYDLVLADVVWIPKFAAAGWIEDLTDRWPAEKWERFIPGAIEGSRYNGRIYRVPTQMNGGILFYRTDLLAAAGLEPPQTFADLLESSRALQEPDKLWGYVWQGRQYEGLVCNYLEILAGHGGTWIDETTGEVGLDSPEAIRALEFLIGVIGDISPRGVTTYAEEESRQLFHAGRAVFHRNWPYVWSLAQQPNSPIRGKVGMVPMPAAPGAGSASTLGGWGFAIASDSSHKEEAWRFMEFIADVEIAQALYESAGAEPALKEFYERTEDPMLKSIYEVMQHTVARPPVPQYAQASDILQRYVSAALTGRLEAEQALRRAARETRLLLGRHGSKTP